MKAPTMIQHQQLTQLEQWDNTVQILGQAKSTLKTAYSKQITSDRTVSFLTCPYAHGVFVKSAKDEWGEVCFYWRIFSAEEFSAILPMIPCLDDEAVEELKGAFKCLVWKAL